MYHTVNIKKFKASHVEKAISPKQSTDRGGRAPKHQATKASSHKSVKPQAEASSVERQASSQAERQAIFFGCGANRQAPSMAFRGGRL